MKKWITLVLLGACMLILGGCSKAKKEPAKLTLETVKELSKKGNELTWSDFEQYESMDIGSGLYILVYEIDENYELMIGGGSPDKSPMYIRLVSTKDRDDYIDIRTDHIDDFINQQSNISNKENTDSFILGEFVETENRERIGNQIPEWVFAADWDKPFYAVSSSDIERFDAYAQENFPNYCDAGWTQEQSDSVYLGQGIEMFALDEEAQINRIIYYPVILNGVIVGGYQVYQQLGKQEISMQASPILANELNAIMDLTNEETPLILGFNNDNTIGIIGDTYYILDIDHMYHKEVSTDKIPVMEYETCINVMEPFCTERIANVDDWVMWNRE